MNEPPQENHRSHAVGWAFYLACSWTWCIGMFLPVLLVRDYGLWGFIVFAVPNVVGAAGMGWVLARPGSAHRIVEHHGAVCSLFSTVTIAFHLFFIQWLGTIIPGAWWIATIVAVPVFAAGLLRRTPPVWRSLAVAVWLVSAIAAAEVLRARADAGDWTISAAQISPRLLWLAPVCVFGFALCPYLDLTFLRARAECTARDARLAFTLGFALLFLIMILLTLLYAPVFASGSLVFRFAGGVTIALIVGHIGLQAIFTCAAHWRECMVVSRGVRVAGPLIGVVLGLPFVHGWTVADMTSHEVVYRCFMSFYGLVFPAYVWLCMVPTPDGHSGLAGERGRTKLLVWSGVVGVAMPFYWMGFVLLDEFYLVPGLLLVLVSRLAVRSEPKSGATSN